MARYNEEARITLNGDRALATRYISEGRKYLGGLTATHPLQTAVRELTNTDGVHFRVGYFAGVPFIDITAGKGGSVSYEIGLTKGFAVAPKFDTTFVTYDANPITIIDPSTGNESTWKSYFHTPVSPLNSTTHPTSAYELGINFYKDFAPNLSTQIIANASKALVMAPSYWKDNAETLFVYVSGFRYLEYRLGNQDTAVIYNGKILVTNLQLTTQLGLYNVYIAGAAAKRTAKGLDLYIAIYTTVDLYCTPGIRILRIGVTPTTEEATRIAEFPNPDGKPLLSYASEFNAADFTAADPTLLETLYTHELTDKYSFGHTDFAWVAFNGSCTECRTFIFHDTDTGTTPTYSEELIFDLSDVENISHEYVAGQSLFSVGASGLDYSSDVFECSYKHEIASVQSNPAAFYGVGTFTINHTDTAMGGSYTAQTGDIAPNVVPGWGIESGLSFGGSTTVSVGLPKTVHSYGSENLFDVEIKALVDYVNDIPVYGYIKPESETGDKLATTDDYTINCTASAVRTITVILDGNLQPVISSNVYTRTTVITGSNAYTYSETERKYNNSVVRCPIYDEEGADTGLNWLNFGALSTYDAAQSGSGNFSMTYHQPSGGSATYTKVLKSDFTQTTARHTYNAEVGALDLKTQSFIGTLRHDETLTTNNVSWDASQTDNSPTFNLPRRQIQTSTSRKGMQQIAIINGVTVKDTGMLYSDVTNNPSDVTTTVNSPLMFGNSVYTYTLNQSTLTTSPIEYKAVYDAQQLYVQVPVAAYPITHGTVTFGYSPGTGTPIHTFEAAPTINHSIKYANTIGFAVRSNAWVLCMPVWDGTGQAGNGSRNYINFTRTSNYDEGAPETTVDYMTGVNNAPWNTSPLHISGMLVKTVKQESN